jgi:hypothetical protein
MAPPLELSRTYGGEAPGVVYISEVYISEILKYKSKYDTII